MRIDKVEIDGFGKLNNCSYDFSDGVNLVYGKNESGKSTLCEFILAMFYGLPNETKRAGDDLASRKKYRPWNSENFGGRLYFTDDNGRKFVIERSFRATKRSDKAVLRDADTWEEIGNAEEIGETCFGLSKDAFLKTLYIKSFGADSLKGDGGEIMSKLSNLETSGNEDVSYSKIINSMEREIFGLKTKTGKGGKITALEEKITALNNERLLASMTYSGLENDKKISQNLKNEAEKKDKEAKILEKEYAVALQHEKYISQKKVEETKAVIKSRLESEEEKLKDLKSQIERINKEDEPLISAEEISRARALETKRLLAEEKMVEAKKCVPEKVRPLLDEKRVIPGFFGLVIFIIGFLIKSLITYIAGMLIAVVGILVCLFINLKKRKDDDKKREAYYELKHEFDRIDEELSSVFNLYGVSNADELSTLFVSANDKEKRVFLLEQQIKDCEKEIEVFKKTLSEETEYIEFSETVAEYDGENAQKLFEKINAVKAEQKEMTERANEILVRVARETAEIRTEDEIISELESISAEKKESEKRYNALMKAYDWLNLSHQEIKNNFAPKLNEKASSILSQLTNEKYTDLKTSDSFDINVKSVGGEIVEAGFMSRGTYDLLYIALRIASMSVLTDGNIPPVILDDAFSQFDDLRLIRAIDLITENDEFSQTILFTCHENYKELFKSRNINIVELE